MTTSIAQIPALLRPGLNAVFADYEDYPAEWAEIFEKHTSNMNYEIDVETKQLGLAQLRTEGAAIAFEDMGQRYTTTYNHLGVGLGFIMTKFAIRDNLYKQQFGPNTRALKRSMAQTKEVYGAAVLNSATDPTVPIGDGQPLLSIAHPIDIGTVANTGSVQQELNETSLQDAIIGISRFRDPAGLLVKVRPKKIVCGPELQFVAKRLMSGMDRVGTADNDINAIRELNLIPGGYVINHYLTDRKSWFMLTDAPEGLKFFQRDPLETDVFTDFTTSNLMTKAEERYSFGVSNLRAIWGFLP